MIRPLRRPNRIKDGIGIAALAGTALLYALQVSHTRSAESCAACEVPSAAPLDATEPRESRLSVTPAEAPEEGAPEGAILIDAPRADLLARPDAQSEAH